MFSSINVQASTTNATPIEFSYTRENINRDPAITPQAVKQYNYNVSNTIPIDAETFDFLVKSGQSAIVYVGFAECPHCEKFVPTLHRFINKTATPIYYLNMDSLGQLNADFISEMQRFQINKTPTVFFLNHGKIIQRYVGDNISEGQLAYLSFLEWNCW